MPVNWDAIETWDRGWRERCDELEEALRIAQVDAEEMNTHRNELLAEVERMRATVKAYLQGEYQFNEGFRRLREAAGLPDGT